MQEPWDENSGTSSNGVAKTPIESVAGFYQKLDILII